MKFALQALETAFANIVLPQPGGPYNKIPAYLRILNFLHFSGFFNGNKINFSNSFLWYSNAPIYSKLILGIEVNPSRLTIGLIFKTAY